MHNLFDAGFGRSDVKYSGMKGFTTNLEFLHALASALGFDVRRGELGDEA